MKGVSAAASRREYWRDQITAAWQAAVEAIFETGRRVIKAKSDKDLPPGQFLQMIENDLPFGRSTADKLMAVARDRRLANSELVPNLPPSWGTLYELHLLEDAQLRRLVAAGRIRPDLDRHEIKAFFLEDHRRERLRRIIETAWPQRRFPVIYADPPWRCRDGDRQGASRRASPNWRSDCRHRPPARHPVSEAKYPR